MWTMNQDRNHFLGFLIGIGFLLISKSNILLEKIWQKLRQVRMREKENLTND